MGTSGNTAHRDPWNNGKIVRQKAPLKVKDIWALRVRLQMERRVIERGGWPLIGAVDAGRTPLEAFRDRATAQPDAG